MSQEVLANHLVFTLTLYDGLNYTIFRLQFVLVGDVDVNSISSLKTLISNALLCAGAVLSKYSLLQDISDNLLLTIDGICLAIVVGWFDYLLM